MDRSISLAATIFAVIIASPAGAQTVPANSPDQQAALPDPSTIALPDLASDDPQVAKDGYKFYYFYNSAVSFGEAYEDLARCRAHLVVGGPLKVPGFVPWDEDHRTAQKRGVPMVVVGPSVATAVVGSLVLSAIGSAIAPKMERGSRSNKMRRCMIPRGYARYAMPEKAWDAINAGTEAQIVAMQAKLASGAKPNGAAVSEE